MIDDRIAERRAEVRDERRRVRLRRTLTVAVVLGIVALLVAVERSPLVGLEEVQVVGTERLDDDTVREAASLELGTSTLRLRMGDARQRVEQLPLVRSAEARRVDPLTVEIAVVERQPALVAVGQGRSVLVDRDGVVMVEEDADGLATIELTGPPPEAGARVEEDPALANAHQAWRELSGPLRAEVERYVATGPDELSLILASGIEIRFGRADRVDEKVRAIGAVLGDIGDADVEVIDVRAPGAPVIVGG